MVTNEGETIQRALLEELRQRRISRRRFIQNTIAAGLSVAGVGVLAGCGAPAAAPRARPAPPLERHSRRARLRRPHSGRLRSCSG